MGEVCRVRSRGKAPGKSALLDLELLVPAAEPLRTVGVDDGLDELAGSIAKMGVLQPLLVRPNEASGGVQRYEVIAGHRRYRAAEIAGLSRVPCIICDVEPEQTFLLALAENLQRDNLHPLDEAWAYDRMIEKGIVRNRTEIARRLGVSRARITQRMQLLRLDEKTKLELVKHAATLSEYHARLLLKLEDLDARHHLAEFAGERGLSGRELRGLIEQWRRSSDVQDWRQEDGGRILPRSYQVSLPGFRLSIDFRRADPSRVLRTLRRLAERLRRCTLHHEPSHIPAIDSNPWTQVGGDDRE